MYMPAPVPNPLNLPISHTFLQTMYVQMQQRTEGQGQIKTRVMLCGQHIRFDYDKQKPAITCQLKLIISKRLQLQVNTCHTLVNIRRWQTHLGELISN